VCPGGLHLTTHPIVSYEGKVYSGEVTTLMHHDESRPSYLLIGLIEKSELRELLDEVYDEYALEPIKEFAL
jgi:hypothetical protein